MAKHFYCFSKFCQYFTKVRIVISDDYSSNIVYSIFIYQSRCYHCKTITIFICIEPIPEQPPSHQLLAVTCRA